MGLLEKKWTAIVRLQKKVLELEAKLADAEETIKAPVKLGGAKDRGSWLPRPPAKYVQSSVRRPPTLLLRLQLSHAFLACAGICGSRHANGTAGP